MGLRSDLHLFLEAQSLVGLVLKRQSGVSAEDSVQAPRKRLKMRLRSSEGLQITLSIRFWRRHDANRAVRDEAGIHEPLG